MRKMVSIPTKLIDYVPFIYGSVAVGLGKTEDGTTHRWTIYVRGVNGKDLSGVISKVVFKLHPTCSVPIVECLQHPFETTQPGWGEFPASIEITFKDEKQSTVSVTHHLRLHHVGVTVPSTKPVVHESYEEAVFNEISSDFTEKLRFLHSQQCPIPSHPLSANWKVFSDQADLAAILKAHAFVTQELDLAIKEYSELNLQKSSTTPASSFEDPLSSKRPRLEEEKPSIEEIGKS